MDDGSKNTQIITEKLHPTFISSNRVSTKIMQGS